MRKVNWVLMMDGQKYVHEVCVLDLVQLSNDDLTIHFYNQSINIQKIILDEVV